LAPVTVEKKFSCPGGEKGKTKKTESGSGRKVGGGQGQVTEKY